MRKFCGLLCSAVFVSCALAGRPPAPRPTAPSFRLQYAPRISAPSGYTVLRRSTNGAGTLYSVDLPSDDGAAYAAGAGVQLLDLAGSPAEAGDAYGELLGEDAAAAYAIQVPARAEALLDWLWRCSLRQHTPPDLLQELEAMDAGGARAGVANLTAKAIRTIVSATLPADLWNIEALIEGEAARHAGNPACAAPPAAPRSEGGRAAAAAAAAAAVAAAAAAWKGAGHCDFFGVWGSLVEDGRLLTSRNLDIE